LYFTFKILPAEIILKGMKYVWFSGILNNFRKITFQYWRIIGLSDNSLKSLQFKQNEIIRICLNKKSLEDSMNQNYKDFKVLPIRSVYKNITKKNKRQH